MKKIDKILNWLILAALVAVVAVCIFNKENDEADESLPSIELSEIQDLFPDAQQLQLLDTSYFAVKDAENETVGSVLLSSPYSDGVKGYAGPTPLLIALDKEGKIMQVRILANRETPGFLKSVTNAGFFESWNGLTVDEALQKDVDAVSGATYSSRGIQNSLKARLAVVSRQSVAEATDNSALWPNLCILLVVVMALVCFFIPQKTKTLRLITLLLSILILGFWRDAMMSLYLFYGWLTNGLSLATEWVLVLVALLAVMLPLFTGKAFYCTYLCPMGALQEMVGKACKKKVKMSNKLVTVLLIIRKLYLLVILVLLALGIITNLVFFEPFSVFSVRSLTVFSVVFAVIILAASLFINRAWCRFLCPTGLLFDLVRRIRK
ncbi:MAG: 4Fe-4S binding protein [Bacteroidales bacterium]|nr:4Fe-4S binding protein [Bacteroidales bacterium]